MFMGTRLSSRRVVAAFVWAALAVGLLFALTLLWAEYHFAAAGKALEKCRFDEARRHLWLCLKVKRWSAAAHLLAAQAARRDGAFSEAVEHLEEAELLGSAPADVELERAMLRCQFGELEDVEDFLSDEVDSKKSPQTPLILEALAAGYMRCDRKLEASDCVDRLLRIQPNNVQALVCRGGILVGMADFGSALEDYQRVLQIDPEHTEARLRLAEALFAVSQANKAIEHFELLRQRWPK